MKVNIVKVESSGIFIAFMDGKGGPVVSDESEEKVKSKLKEAFNLGLSVKNIKQYIHNRTMDNYNIEFCEVKNI